MKIALLQQNYTVGDVAGNAARVAAAVRKAAAMGADLALATELAVNGYPPRDLLLNKGFVEAGSQALEGLARELGDSIPVLVGVAEENPSEVGKPVFNCAVLLRDGEVAERFHKNLLPTYDVFDEQRYFEPGPCCGVARVGGLSLGVTVCEDVWNDKDFWRNHRWYPEDPVERLAGAGVDCLLNLSASPFTLGKQAVREAMLARLASKYRVPVLYANQVGGNDDLVFAGRSMAFDASGRLVARAKGFEEDILLVDLKQGGNSVAPDDFSRESEAWRALVLGTRDYVRKCGFSRVLLGLSGGVDSSLTAAVAAHALGPDNVLGVLMPSPYSSQGSIDDALELARRLSIRTMTLPISGIMDAYDKTLREPFQGLPQDITEENIQSRIRGNLLMALSNKYGSLLLTTGNKSELAVGYCTIYGDMAGGLAVISDLPKSLVYSLCRWLNLQQAGIIPEQVLDKPPSAELRPDQKDQDSLPPYEVLDAVLERCIEGRQSLKEIVGAGFEREVVERILSMVRLAEFKRRQAPPGIKITDRAFGTGWRMPIARAGD